LPKSKLSEKPTKGEDIWQHPCAPLAVNSQGIAAIRLNTRRPAWTGLAQLLAPLSKEKGRPAHPLEGPAPVLRQWKTLGKGTKAWRLLVLDFDRDKANIRRRFFEAFPLTDDLATKQEAIERLRLLVTDAQTVEQALVHGLRRAHDGKKRGGFALADAQTAFWSASDAPFLTWLAVATSADQDTDAGEGRANSAQHDMAKALRRTAESIFDAHVALSDLDPGKQERIAKARKHFHDELWPRAKSPAPTAVTSEVNS
ncbi:MAG: type I-E CRISPR-associated protein Cse1/CasA, partial [Deltaproteobacteria bacterium]